MNNTSIERLREVFSYNPETGILLWKAHTGSNRNYIGRVAGGASDKRGYSYVRLDKTDYTVQRVIWAIVTGEFPVGKIKFRDNNPRNLKWENLALHRGIKGYDSRTPEGKAAYGKAYRAANPDKCRDRSLRQDFGITFAEYQEMLKSQNGVCAICEKGETAIRNGKQIALCVDHHHGTGYVRALRCRGCNQGIGNFVENLKTMQNAIAYLEKHNKKHSEDNVVAFKGK